MSKNKNAKQTVVVATPAQVIAATTPAPVVDKAAKKLARAAKAEAKSAKTLKRRAGLEDTRKTDATKFAVKVNFKDAKALAATIYVGGDKDEATGVIKHQTPVVVTDWNTYCAFKSAAWAAAATKPAASDAKKLAKLAKRKAELKAKLAALDVELGIAPESK